MLKFWQIRGELESLNLKSYALKCVKNECLNRLKRETIKQNFADLRGQESEYYEMETDNLKEEIIHFINKLPEKQKLVIHLKDVEEYEVSEISEILEIDENAVRLNLMRARQKIKEQIINLMSYEQRQISR
jgi:RNA polymerase sigma-70 factor (ECF subfamily)